jgi:mannose-6-phosphate isomerase-like protein (cupin superfamily)
MITGKVWGTTELVLATPLLEIHRLTIKPAHQCSLHVHRKKWNAFVVTRGRLFVDVRKTDYDLIDTTELRPGDWTTVKPGEHHKFRTGRESCEAFELYYLDPLSEDIDRKGVGGKIGK